MSLPEEIAGEPGGVPSHDLLDEAPCGFLTFGDDGVVTRANATLLRLLGYERERVVGEHVERLFTVATRIFYQTHWFPLLRLHGRAEEIFLMLRSSTGEDVGMLVNAVRTERQGVVEYDCVLMRLRERQKYEEELLRARREADRAREEVEDMNARLEEQAVELEAQHLQLQEQAVDLELVGEELRVMNEDLLARNEEAEHLRDVAEDANRAKSEFLAVMSHELRTPLNAIGGYVQLLEMEIHGPVTDAQREALARVSAGQRHLLRLINDVLDLARIESGRAEYHIEEFPLAETVSLVRPLVEPQLESKGLTFAVHVPAGVLVRADREKVQQILINLLGNAVKFTPAGGSVSVHGAVGGESRVLLSVIDSGIGIPPSKLASIFEPYSRVDTNAHRAIEGTGLGLAISSELARGMGGTLTARSTLGEGSTFTLSLPAVHHEEVK